MVHVGKLLSTHSWLLQGHGISHFSSTTHRFLMDLYFLKIISLFAALFIFASIAVFISQGFGVVFLCLHFVVNQDLGFIFIVVF